MGSTVERIPKLIDVDARVVEPADVWSSRLPTRYVDAGPRIELLPGGTPKLVGSSYVEEAPGPGAERQDRPANAIRLLGLDR